jgi:hypothetical protein
MKQAEPLLIAPECSAPGCHRDGDAYLMIKCHSCDQWFCEEHFGAAETAEAEENGNRRQRITGVPTVKLVKTGLDGLAYYLGCCMACRAKQAGRRPVDSSWLR